MANGFINPIDGVYERFSLHEIKVSNIQPSNTQLSQETVEGFFPKLQVAAIEQTNSATENSIDINLQFDNEFVATISVTTLHQPTRDALIERINAKFLGISAPVPNAYVDQNNFSDFTAALSRENLSAVSSKGTVIVHTKAQPDKGIDGIEINKSILGYMFSK